MTQPGRLARLCLVMTPMDYYQAEVRYCCVPCRDRALVASNLKFACHLSPLFCIRAQFWVGMLVILGSLCNILNIKVRALYMCSGLRCKRLKNMTVSYVSLVVNIVSN